MKYVRKGREEKEREGRVKDEKREETLYLTTKWAEGTQRIRISNPIT